MDRAVAIANEFLRKPGGFALTQMQLQKLVYFAHGWTLALTGNPLTLEQPEAWAYGPVYRDLYDHSKFFGRGPISREITSADDEAARFFMHQKGANEPYRAKLDRIERAIIDHVWKRYGSLSGAKLSALTHQPGTPWSNTYREGQGQNCVIPNNAIETHYQEIAKSAGQKLA